MNCRCYTISIESVPVPQYGRHQCDCSSVAYPSRLLRSERLNSEILIFSGLIRICGYGVNCFYSCKNKSIPFALGILYRNILKQIDQSIISHFKLPYVTIIFHNCFCFCERSYKSRNFMTRDNSLRPDYCL